MFSTTTFISGPPSLSTREPTIDLEGISGRIVRTNTAGNARITRGPSAAAVGKRDALTAVTVLIAGHAHGHGHGQAALSGDRGLGADERRDGVDVGLGHDVNDVAAVVAEGDADVAGEVAAAVAAVVDGDVDVAQACRVAAQADAVEASLGSAAVGTAGEGGVIGRHVLEVVGQLCNRGADREGEEARGVDTLGEGVGQVSIGAKCDAIGVLVVDEPLGRARHDIFYRDAPPLVSRTEHAVLASMKNAVLTQVGAEKKVAVAVLIAEVYS